MTHLSLSGAVLTIKPTHSPPTSPSVVTQTPPSSTPSTAPSPEIVVTTGLNDSVGVVTPEVPTAPPVVTPPILPVPTKAPAAPPTPSAESPSLTTLKTGVLATTEPPTPDPTPTQSTSEPETDTPSAPADATTADFSKPPGTIYKVISYKQSTEEPANICTVIIEQLRESVQKAPFIRKPIMAAGGHRTELSRYHGNDWLFVPLHCGRFKKYKQAGSHSNSFRLTNGRADDTELQSVPLLARSPSTNRKYPPLPVDKLEEEMNRRMADDNKLFREEFNALPVCPIQASCDAASKEENKEKNRYVNILPCKHAYTRATRVHLTSLEGVPDSDYINASYINGYQEKNKFIAAQGPKEETVNDFWRMIWEQNTATIVMVTNLKERKECKCAQYWPDQGCWTYGNIRVSVEDMMVLVDYTIRKFCIQQVGDVSGKKPQRLVTQFHFTSWPDFGVPFTPIGMLKFLKKVKNCNPQYAGPIVVHCSAGVGRTGTFIVIDAMLDMMGAERKVDVFGFVTRIRAQRCQMVQTDMQYVFIFQALLEHYLYGDTELEVTSLESHLNKLYAPLPGAGCGGMEAEFKKLTSIKIQNDKMRTGNLPANMKKNRVLQIIPYEFNRVIIPVKRGEENTDYINASFIDGYRQKDSYMACQGPLQHTIEDFWRMIWEWRSCSIVMLTELEERGQEKCAQYWSSDGVMVCGDMSIELKREEESESYTVRDLLVTNNRENKARAVRQFHFHGWPEVGIPSDGKGMINIIAAVQKQQQQSGNHPITVHCSAGAGRTGTFCALSTVLERVKAEGILDVFQTVKSLRLQRPHMVQTLEQYEFCYKVVQEYIDAFSDYANFK
uniref:Receptor-type tyrosine-protein phosphatase alpha n=1 Tax=Cyprinus carpio TaxID=7962 RepID=A0A8C1Q1C5_CYPCA